MKLSFRNRKQEDPLAEAGFGSIEANRLRDLCGADTDLYTAMSRLMFLDPNKIKTPLDQVLNEAQEYETQNNRLRAEVAYRIAGGISLYKGDLQGVEKYFSKAASFAGDSHHEYQVLIKKVDMALAVARKFYEDSGPEIKRT